MVEFTKDDYLLMNGIIILAFGQKTINKTEGVLSLQRKIIANLKEMI